MAIAYIETRIVNVGRGDSLVGLQRYICRQTGNNPLDGRWYYFGKDAADLASYDVLLPQCAPLAFHDPTKLCVAAEQRETTVDRKTGLLRFKTNAQAAKHIVLALPKELSPKEHRRLACAWVRSQYVNNNVGAIVAVHHPDNPVTGNAHAHVLLTTRVVTASGLGPKARHLNPRFSTGKWTKLHADDLPGRWAAFQDAWFRKAGIELRVDPFQRRGGIHIGPARFQPGSDAEARNKQVSEESRELIKDPAEALALQSRRKAIFSRAEIAALFRRHGFSKAEVKELTDRVLAHPDVVPLHDPNTGARLPLYTTRQVRAQERRIMEAADVLLAAFPDPKRRSRIAAAARKRASAMNLTVEQSKALGFLTKGPNLRILRGIAGAGKSYTIRSVRESLEAGGFRVIGLAPTNTVACAMAVDGFAEASTVDLELIRQESIRPPEEAHPASSYRTPVDPWDSNTCLVIDEAGMIDAGRYERVLLRAAAAGARVILVGDEKQLASVERGGIFDFLKQRHGCVELLDVRRQAWDWAKVATQDFAAGRMGDALGAYDKHSRLHWSDDLDQAMAQLVRRWGEDMRRHPAASRFVYAATNKTVDKLNAALQAERWKDRQTTFGTYTTKREETEFKVRLSVGDRIQIRGTDRKLGLYNGVVGTVTIAEPDRIAFTTDAGQTLRFDPREFQTWTLGYCGTTYRGQGQTQAQVYALYDHQLAWHARTSYVGFTRHKDSMDMFVPRTLAGDLDALVRQMSRADQNQASITLLDATEAEQIKQKAPATPATLQPIKVKIGKTISTFNAASEQERADLAKTLTGAPMGDVRKLYLKHQRSPDPNIQDLCMRLANLAKQRGMHVVTGRPHPEAIADLRRDDEPLHHDRTIAPIRGEVDFRPYLQPSLGFSMNRSRRAGKILDRLDVSALKGLRDAGWSAWKRAGVNERLRYPIVIAMAQLQAWSWRRRDKIGFDLISAEAPGVYRSKSLSLLDKARKGFRVFGTATTDRLQQPTPVPTTAVAKSAAIPAPIAAAGLLSWEERQRLLAERATRRQELENRRARIETELRSAVGNREVELQIDLGGVTEALRELDRPYPVAGRRPEHSSPSSNRLSSQDQSALVPDKKRREAADVPTATDTSAPTQSTSPQRPSSTRPPELEL